MSNIDKEDSRYYTPTIEEFYVGFEYRICDIETAHYGMCIFQDGQSVQNLLDGDYGEVDVKYLDKEDIESLGFINTKQYSDEMVFQLHTSDYEFYELTWQFEDDSTIIIECWSQEKMVAKVLPKETWGHVDIFIGHVKNKSEFKKLLTQLGIS